MSPTEPTDDAVATFLEERVRSASTGEWRRLWSAELLFLRHDPGAHEGLRTLATGASDPQVRLRALLSLAQHALEDNDVGAAKAHFEQAYLLRPESIPAAWQLGALLAADEPKRAADLLSVALENARQANAEGVSVIAGDLCKVLRQLGDTERCRSVLEAMRGPNGDLPSALRDVLESLPGPDDSSS